MSSPSSTARNASRLVYKAIQPTLSPVNDAQYRELLDLYRADPGFAAMVGDVAEGLELVVLDFSERGLVVVPASRESKFAYRLTDLRSSSLKSDQKAGLLLAHIAVAAVFYPTTDGLENDSFIPPPANLARFRDTLLALAKRLKDDAGELDLKEVPVELAPGWELICSLPLTVPGGQRSTLASVSGLIGIALSHMATSGLLRVDRESADDEQRTHTPTHRLQVQLRELTLRRIFELAQTGSTMAGRT